MCPQGYLTYWLCVFYMGTMCSAFAHAPQEDGTSVPLNQSLDAKVARLSALFDQEVIIEGPEVVDCTLSGGTQSQCVSMEVQSLTEHEKGPWCPSHIKDGIQKGGMMFYEGEVYGIDGEFVKNLAQFFNDKQWQLFDPKTGAINVTTTQAACKAAAKPDVADEYINYCVQCQVAYMGDNVSTTYVIPINPIIDNGLQRANEFTGYGLAFNGVKFDISAPIEQILSAYTLAPFDACGGHVNLHVGYHYHAAMGCSTQWRSVATHAPKIGLAVDGHMIYSRLNADGQEPDDLDSCRGHEFANLGYHYHVNLPGKNEVIGCLKGQQGCALSQGQTVCDASKKRPLMLPKSV